MPVKLDDLLVAFEATDFDMGGSALLCRTSGEIYCEYAFDPGLSDELPEDADDETKYIQLPDKRELGLGKPLALAFAEEHLPGDFSKVREIFSRKGAYARFGDLLEYRGVRDKWHAFVDEATKRALREWCEDNEIEIVE